MDILEQNEQTVQMHVVAIPFDIFRNFTAH